MMVRLVLNSSQTFFLLSFFVTVAAVHPSSVHVSGGQGSAVGIRVLWGVSLVFSGKESQSIR